MNAVKRALILTHRWLGILLAPLMVLWFLSGVTMMYARMPQLSPDGRLAHLEPFDASTLRVTLADAARLAGNDVERVRMAMLRSRPVYRFLSGNRWVTVFADTGEQLERVTPDEAVAIAKPFAEATSQPLRHVARIEEPDQWTLQIRPMLPAHVVSLDDPDSTQLYISERGGEVVLRTTRRARLLAYAGAVMHWLYFTPLRRNGSLWTQVVIWTSIAGCVLCLSGLVWGVWQFARHRGTPYRGVMRWHHYVGLVFGALALTFVFSGLLSMDPWSWSPSTAPGRAIREHIAGGRLDLERVPLSQFQAAAAVLARDVSPREIEIIQFQRRLYLKAYELPAQQSDLPDLLRDPTEVTGPRAALPHRLVALDAPERGTFSSFDRQELLAAVQGALPGVSITESSWLSEYDAYYYDRDGVLPLPVLRIKFSDPVETWLYVDPYDAAAVRKEQRLSRLNRWLYHGFHSFDWPWLYSRRPVWDIALILSLAMGIVMSLTAVWRLVVSR